MKDRVMVEYTDGPRKGQRAWMHPDTAAKPAFAGMVKVVAQRQRSPLGVQIVKVGSAASAKVPAKAPAKAKE